VRQTGGMLSTPEDDPYRWLEEVDSPRASAWVRERSEATAAALEDEDFTRLRDELRRVLDDEDRIPVTTWHGGHLYNLWRDAAHPRGLWRRTTLSEYRRPEPDWQVLLDVDGLAADEEENWVWQGFDLLRPDHRRALVYLSRGGSDARLVREFDMTQLAFVNAGFTLAEAKSTTAWVDADHIFVGTDLGPGSLTSSGYPRTVLRWRRGTPLAEAEPVFEGDVNDVSVHASHDPTPGFARDVVQRWTDFFSGRRFVRPEGSELTALDVPDDADVDLHRQWLLVRPRSEWTVGGATHPAGSVLITELAGYLAGERELTVLFRAAPDTSLASWTWTRGHLILSLLTDVRSRQVVCTPGPDGWTTGPLYEGELGGHVDMWDSNPDESDEYLLSESGYLQPTRLWHGIVGGPLTPLRSEPAFFDPDGMSVRQFFAASQDGTRVPYYVVGAEGGDGPALLTGYGGFEISRTPAYDALVGRGWLARGGTYVVANIRGGGEYGPDWHHAAMRERRPRAYEDFAAVAADLVERGVTTRDRLGVWGRSNGGLLAGVMLTRYPRLFGAVVSEVPLLDMRRYHELLAGASWMAEYGNPDDEADWAFISGYSPYHNVRSGQSYPPVLLLTSTRDDRVHPGHARKMAALLAEQGHDVTYYENTEGGHGGAADNAQLAYMRALVYEFLWRRLAPRHPLGHSDNRGDSGP
jgi:prolyl oligopeptidase